MDRSETSCVDGEGTSSSPTGTFPETVREAQWTDNVVPPIHKNRTLIVCFDGTGDKFDNDVSLTCFRPRRAKASDGLPEFQRRSIHLDVEEGQQARANGVLSGDDQF